MSGLDPTRSWTGSVSVGRSLGFIRMALTYSVRPAFGIIRMNLARSLHAVAVWP